MRPLRIFFPATRSDFIGMCEIGPRIIREAIDLENEQPQNTIIKGIAYAPELFANDNTPKQLLDRYRYLLYKVPSSKLGTTSKKSLLEIS